MPSGKCLGGHRRTPEDTVRKLDEEDQQALAALATAVARVWLAEGPLDEGGLSALWVSAFPIGHDWVKEHWALW